MTENTTEQERAAYERELIDNHHYVPSDFSFKDGFYGGDDDYIQFGWDLWQAARRAQAVPVPQGWKLVPVEPTQEMVDSGSGCWMMTDDNAAGYWAAMIAAAPQPPEAKASVSNGTFAAPVELPEPAGITSSHDGEFFWFNHLASQVIRFGARLYTEQQVRQLLAAHGIKVAP